MRQGYTILNDGSSAKAAASAATSSLVAVVVAICCAVFVAMIPAIIAAVRSETNTGLLREVRTNVGSVNETTTTLFEEVQIEIASVNETNVNLIEEVQTVVNAVNTTTNGPISSFDFCRHRWRTLDHTDWSDHPPRRDACIKWTIPNAFLVMGNMSVPSAAVNMNRLAESFNGFFFSAGSLSVSWNNAISEVNKYRLLSCFPTTYQEFADHIYCDYVGRQISRETWFSAFQTQVRAKKLSNQEAFGKYRLKQLEARRQETVTETSFKKRAFNTILPFPLMNCPSAITVDMRGTNGDKDIAATMNKLGLPFTASYISTHKFQDLATANRQYRSDSVRLAQLYLFGKANGPHQLSVINTIMTSGYNGVVLTQDAQAGGEMRLEELRSGRFNGDGFIDDGFGAINSYADPFLNANLPGFPSTLLNVEVCGRTKNKTLCPEPDRRLWRSGTQFIAASGRNAFAPNFYNWTMDDAIALKQHMIANYGSNKLVIIKAMFDEDGIRKMINGCLDGFWLSDHHQRFNYHTPHPIDLIATYSQIVDAEFAAALTNMSHPRNLCPPELRSRDNFTIVFDSGVREGADVVRALALGADVVGMGKNTIMSLGLGAQLDPVNGPSDALTHRFMTVIAQALYDIRRLGVSDLNDLKLKYRDQGRVIVQPDAYDRYQAAMEYDSYL